MASFNEKALPPVPYKVAVVNSSGMLSVPWANFFRQLWNRAGGGEALSNTDLEDLQTVSFDSIQAEVDALQATVASLQSTVSDLSSTSGLDSLNQGRQL